MAQIKRPAVPRAAFAPHFLASAFLRQMLDRDAQQGAAPDRRQFGSLRGFSALLKVGRDWAAAGELGR